MPIRDIMTKNVVTVPLDMDVHKLAELFISKNISGAPVVDAAGKVLGIVREEGVIFQDKNVHLPTFISLAVGFLTVGTSRYEAEMKKIAASSVEDIMERDPVTITPAMGIEEVATLMLEKNVYYLPVVDNGALAGVITKKDIVRSIAGNR